MGKIINSKINPDKKVIFKVLTENDEVSNLRGHLRNVGLFSSDQCIHESQINTRGNNGVTKYFKIPLSIRSRKKQSGNLSYQKISTPAKIYYIYILEKELSKNGNGEEKKNKK